MIDKILSFFESAVLLAKYRRMTESEKEDVSKLIENLKSAGEKTKEENKDADNKDS